MWICIHFYSKAFKKEWNMFFMKYIFIGNLLLNWTEYILETATEQIGHDKQKNPMMHNFLPNHSVRWKVFVILWYNHFYWSFCSILLIFFYFQSYSAKIVKFLVFLKCFSSFICPCGRLLSEVTYLLHVRSCI